MKKENSLSVKCYENEKTGIKSLLPKAAGVFAAVFGFSAMFFEALGSENTLLFGFISGALAAFCLFINKKNIPIFVSAGCFGLLFLIPGARNGMFLIANEIIDFMISKTGKIFLPFDVAENANENLALLFMTAGVSIFISAAALEKNPIFALPLCLLSTAGLLFGFLSTGIYFCVFAAGIFCLCFSEKLFRKKNIAVFSVAAICVAFCFVLAGSVPSGTAERIKNFAEDYAHGVFYDSKTNAMPEGKLKNLGVYEKNDAQALEITMEKPQKLYLKGFVGEIYNGYGWESLEKEALSEYADDFYILHENGFFGQKAVSSALSATGNKEESAMSIRNISACSERVYLPYAVFSAVPDRWTIGDAEMKATAKKYEISYIPGGLLEWYGAQVELSEMQGSEAAVDEHLANEIIYREFVKANYLSVPEDIYNTIDRIFAEKEASTATEIISAILLYFEENTEYDENVVTKNGEEDFASFFLEKTARGYSVHYATAATLMLRYFGIPTRYVEGYFISAEEAENIESGKAFVLTENHSHAWAEYYLEGVGWIPFEVTPGYMDDELEKAAFRTTGESSKRYEQNELPETNVEQEKPKDDITEAKRNYAVIITAVIAAGVLLLLAAAVYIAVMRKRLKKALLAIENADNKTAVPMRFGYAQRLLENSCVNAEDFGYEEAFAINREALFSEHKITDEQRRTVDDFAEKVLAECKDSWNLWRKIKYRFIKFIY